jgi:hypothetical protein
MPALSRRTLLSTIAAAAVIPILRGTPAFAVARDITVTDGAGRPIPEADLTIRIPRKRRRHPARRPRRKPPRKPDLVVRRRTDRSGRAHIPLPPDIDCSRRVEVIVRARGRRYRRNVDLCRHSPVIRIGGGRRRDYAPSRRPGTSIGLIGDEGD